MRAKQRRTTSTSPETGCLRSLRRTLGPASELRRTLRLTPVQTKVNVRATVLMTTHVKENARRSRLRMSTVNVQARVPAPALVEAHCAQAL